jgi:hypothetical protein
MVSLTVILTVTGQQGYSGMQDGFAELLLSVELTLTLALRLQELALDAVRSVTVDIPGGGREIDVKKYAKVSGMQIQVATPMVVLLIFTGGCL